MKKFKNYILLSCYSASSANIIPTFRDKLPVTSPRDLIQEKVWAVIQVGGWEEKVCKSVQVSNDTMHVRMKSKVLSYS